MPRIPVYESNILPKSTITQTGLQPARIDNPIPQAIAEIGQTIGNIGEMIYKRELQHREEDKKVYLLDKATTIETALSDFHTKIAEAKSPDEIINIYNDFSDYKKQSLDKNNLSLENISNDTPLDKRMHQIGGFTSDEIATYQLNLIRAFNNYDAKLAAITATARDTRAVQAGQATTNIATLGWIDGVLTRDQVKAKIVDAYSFVKNAPIHIANEIQRTTVTYLNDAFDKENIDIINAFNKGAFNKDLMGATGDHGLINQLRDRSTKVQNEIDINNKYNQVKTKYGNDFEKAMQDVRNDKSLPLSQQKSVLAILRTEQNDYDESINKEKRDGHETDMNNIYGAINNKRPKDALKFTRGSVWLNEHEKNTIYKSLEEGSDPFKKTDGGTALNIYNNIMADKYPEDYRFSAIPGVLNRQDAEHFTELNKQMHKEDITARKEAMRYIQKTIITGGGGKIDWQFNADGSINMNTNASPDLQQKAYKATKELNDTLDHGLRNKKNLRDMVTPGNPDYIVDKVIMGNSPSFKDSVSAQLQKLKLTDLFKQVKGFKTTEDAVNYLMNTYGYNKTQAIDLVRQGHKSGYY
jgi:hypothetical protein